MKKNYFIFLVITLAFFMPQFVVAQNSTPIKQNIDGLHIYPNPINREKIYIYINSKNNLSKKVEIYNVLGRQILSTRLIGRVLNISNFNKGVYIIKVTENNINEIRKLVIK